MDHSATGGRDRVPGRGGAESASGTASAAAPETWELWRQDDNGNIFLVSVHPDEGSASLRMSGFESGTVHKQHYWIKRK